MTRHRTSRLRTPLLLAAPLAVAGVYFLFAGIEEPIQRAVEKKHVVVHITAKDDKEATIQVARGGGAPLLKSLTIIVPVGTVIRNNDRGGQWLMTAKKATLLLGARMPRAETTVETYCLHQFDVPPTLTSSLELAPPGSDGSAGEYESTRRLAECLENLGARHPRQLAAWMTSDGLLDLGYREVEDRLRRGIQRQAARQGLEEVKADLFQRVRSDPSLRGTSDQALSNAIEAYVAARADQYDPAAIERSVQQQMSQFLTEARPLLRRCLPDASSKTFFLTAP